MAIQLKRGTSATRTSYIPADGELLIVDTSTTTPKVYVGDGNTAGGKLVADPSSSGGGGAGGNAFANIAVSGQTTVIAESTTDTVTLVAGTGISLATDAVTDSVIITNTVAGGGGGGASTFADLSDTPVSITPADANKIIKINANGTAIVFENDTAGLTAVSQDLTPELGGNLSVNGKTITSTSSGNVTISPDGAGKIVTSGKSMDLAGGKITYTSSYANFASLPSAITYEGLVALDDDTNFPYMAIDGTWTRLAKFSEAGGGGGGASQLTALTDITNVSIAGAGTYLKANGDGTFTFETISIPAALTDLGISDGINGQVLSTNGNGIFSFSSLGIPTALTDLNIVDGTVGQHLQADGDGTFTFVDAPTVPTSLTDLSIVDGTIGQVLQADGDGTFTFVDQVDSILDLGISDGQSGQVLSTTGAGSFSFITISGGGSSITSILDLGISDGTVGQHLQADGDGTFTFVDAPVIPANTDALSEGATNLYYTNGRADARIGLANVGDLTDVTTTGGQAPTDGQVMTWSQTNSDWRPADSAGGGGGAATGISHTDTISITTTNGNIDLTATSAVTVDALNGLLVPAGQTGYGALKYYNAYSHKSDLPDAALYHGSIGHVHTEGAVWYGSHAGAQYKMALHEDATYTGHDVNFSSDESDSGMKSYKYMGATTNATQTQIYVGNSSGYAQPSTHNMAGNQASVSEYELYVTALRTNSTAAGDAATASWKFTFSAWRDAYTNSGILGTVTKTIIGQQGLSTAYDVSVDISSGIPRVRVTGTASHNVRWHGKLDETFTTSSTATTASYQLTSNQTDWAVTEGESFIITLATTNVTAATNIPYTITGVATGDINNASLTGNFVVGTTDSITFITTSDGLTEGGETFTLTLDNSEDAISISFEE